MVFEVARSEQILAALPDWCLKQRCEVVADGGAVLSIVLAGHSKLRNAFLRPTMEEIAPRFAVFPFEGMTVHQADYIAWLLESCQAGNIEPAAMMEPAAVVLSPSIDDLEPRLARHGYVNEHCRGIPHQAGQRAPLFAGKARARATPHRADARRGPPRMRQETLPFPARRLAADPSHTQREPTPIIASRSHVS